MYKNRFLIFSLALLVVVEIVYLVLTRVSDNPLSFYISCSTYNIYLLLLVSIVINTTLVHADIFHGAIQFQLMGDTRRVPLLLAKFLLVTLLFLFLFLLLQGMAFLVIYLRHQPFMDPASLEYTGYSVSHFKTMLWVSLGLVGVHLLVLHSINFAVSTFLRNGGFVILLCLFLYAVPWVLNFLGLWASSNMFLSGVVTYAPLNQIFSTVNQIDQMATGFVSLPWETGKIICSFSVGLFLFVFFPGGAIILFSRKSLL